jgi:hypothetical protein
MQATGGVVIGFGATLLLRHLPEARSSINPSLQKQLGAFSLFSSQVRHKSAKFEEHEPHFWTHVPLVTEPSEFSLYPPAAFVHKKIEPLKLQSKHPSTHWTTILAFDAGLVINPYPEAA